MTTPAPAQPVPPPSGPEREDQAQQAGAAVGAAFAAAEAAILAAIAASILAVAAGSLGVAMAKRKIRMAVTSALGAAMHKVNPVIAALPPAAQAPIRQAVLNAQASAAQSAAKALAAVTGKPSPGTPSTIPAGSSTSGHRGGPDASELAMRQLREAKGSKGGPYRDVADAHKAAVQAAMAEKMSRLRQAQKVMDDLARQGITGFTDKAGRNWSLSAYAEMSTRTAQSRLILQDQLKLMGPAGVTLVIVDEPMGEAACPRCRPWVGRVLSLVPFEAGSSSTITDAHGVKRTEQIAGTLSEAVSAGLLHPNCFPAEVLVTVPSGVRAADARWYEGELVVIHTARGDELPVTPNHPVATPEGWVAAGDLQVGQHVLRYDLGQQRVDSLGSGMGPDDDLVPARIGDVFDALRHARGVTAARVPASPEQFHGDGGDAYVDVVLADGLLEHDGDAERVRDGALLSGGARQRALLAKRALLKVGQRALRAPDGIMRGGSEDQALCWRHARNAAAVDLAPAYLAAGGDDVPAQGGLRDSEIGGDDRLRLASLEPADRLADLLRRLAAVRPDASRLDLAGEGGLAYSEGGGHVLQPAAGPVTLDRIVSLGRRQVATHVYNLQAGDGWYVANGMVVHNCEHDLVPWHDGTGLAATAGGAPRGYVVAGQPVARALPNGTPQDYVNRQKLRAHERTVRNAQMGVAAALSPQAKQKARTHLAGARTALEAHVAATGVTRLPGRERVFRGDKAAHPGQPFKAR